MNASSCILLVNNQKPAIQNKCGSLLYVCAWTRTSTLILSVVCYRW